MSAEILEVFRGEDFTFRCFISNEDGGPFDLTGATEITARFIKSDGSVLSKTLTGSAIVVNSAEGGDISISLNDTDTESLKVGAKQAFDVKVDIGSTTRICYFSKNLTVSEAIA